MGGSQDTTSCLAGLGVPTNPEKPPTATLRSPFPGENDRRSCDFVEQLADIGARMFIDTTDRRCTSAILPHRRCSVLPSPPVAVDTSIAHLAGAAARVGKRLG